MGAVLCRTAPFQKIQMKIRLLLLFALISARLDAQNNILSFDSSSMSQILTVAERKHKPVLVYVAPNDCPGDIRMRETAFRNNTVIKFYDENFLMYRFWPETEEGKKIVEQFNIKHFPTFVFVDASGAFRHKIFGEYSSDDFIAEGKNALSDRRSLSAMKKQYLNGHKASSLLYDYSYQLLKAGEPDSSIVDEYLNSIDVDEYKTPKNLKFIYDFSVADFNSMLSSNSPAFKFLYKNSKLFEKYHNRYDVETKIVWLLTEAANKATAEKNEPDLIKIMHLLKPYDNGTLYEFKNENGNSTGGIGTKYILPTYRLQFYEVYGDSLKYELAVQRFLDAVWNDGEELNSFAYDYYERFSDLAKLRHAIKAVKRSIALNKNAENLDTYAALLLKKGDMAEARKQALLALEYAEKSKLDLQHYKAQLSTIERSLIENK